MQQRVVSLYLIGGSYVISAMILLAMQQRVVSLYLIGGSYVINAMIFYSAL